MVEEKQTVTKALPVDFRLGAGAVKRQVALYCQEHDGWCVNITQNGVTGEALIELPVNN